MWAHFETLVIVDAITDMMEDTVEFFMAMFDLLVQLYYQLI